MGSKNKQRVDGGLYTDGEYDREKVQNPKAV